MRAIFGVLSLVIALAVVASLAMRQGGGQAAAVTSTGSPGSVPSGTLPQQSKSIQDKVRDDTARALQQGADRTDRAVDSTR